MYAAAVLGTTWKQSSACLLSYLDLGGGQGWETLTQLVGCFLWWLLFWGRSALDFAAALLPKESIHYLSSTKKLNRDYRVSSAGSISIPNLGPQGLWADCGVHRKLCIIN